MSLFEVTLIGRRISIISKAQIRYEGFLHSVDFESPSEPVITLSKVWSFGTEDRQCERPVAPRNEEYNQVVFRGRDLKDVRLVQSSVFLNEDSAIVSAAPGTSISSHAPGTQTSEPKSDESHSCDHLSSLLSASLDNPVSSAPSLNTDAVLPTSSRASASAFHLPTVGSRPGPIGTLLPDSAQIPDPRGPRPFGDGRSEGDPGVFGGTKKLDFFARQPPASTSGDVNNQRTIPGSVSRIDAWNSRVTNFRPAGNNFFRGAPTRHVSNNTPNQDYYRGRRGGFYNQWSGQQRGGRYPQNNYYHRGNRSGHNYNWSRIHSGVPPASSEPATFSGEYDYEKANAELAVELEKITISTKSGSSLDGDNGKADDSGGSVTDETNCYDQTKSFFDTLSSELMDKANGVTSLNINRRDERVLNSATFGVFPRRGGYGGGRAGGSYGNYSYGQRRSGGYWRSGNNTGSKNPYSSGPPPPPTVGSTS